MNDEDRAARMSETIGNGIQQAIANERAGYVGKWVAVCEAINDDGQRSVWTFSQDDSQVQDSIALHNYALELNRVQFLKDAIEGRD